ncbi:MAG: hypothetical protein WC357_03025 [Candidatus Omnitrophota bacterium]|jgi:hypothetical protein
MPLKFNPFSNKFDLVSDTSGYALVDQTMYIGTTSTTINRASAVQTLAGITLTTPNIGTPSAGVLTNCTGLPYTGIADGTDGNLITWDADGHAAVVATGDAGEVLTSNGAGAAPTFQAAGGGGATTALDNLAVTDINADLDFQVGRDANITVKDQTVANTNGDGLYLIAGAGKGTAIGGWLELTAGAADVDGKGGDMLLWAGNGGSDSGDGGDFSIYAGEGIVDNGGNIYLFPGVGAGVNGAVNICDPSGIYAVLDTSLLTTADKTFTFPDTTGTFALAGDTMYIGTTGVTLNRASAALTLAGITLTTPDIGTPSAGVLTNCTGLPYTGLANGTAGNLITWSAAGIADVVATGDSGEVLTSNGAGAAPTFQAAGGGGLVWGAAVSGTTTGGTSWTLNNNSDASAIGISVTAENTQSRQSCLCDLEIGTSTNVMGLMIKGTGSATVGAVGTGENHLLLWANTENNTNTVFALGNGTSYRKAIEITGQGIMNFYPNAGATSYIMFNMDKSYAAKPAQGLYLTGTLNATVGSGIRFIYANASWATGALSAVDKDYVTLSTTRTNNRTSGTTADNFDTITVARTSVTTGAGGTFTVDGALLKLASTCTQTNGTLTDNTFAIEIAHNTFVASTRTWCVSITHNNAATDGLACGIDMSSFSVDEPLLKVVADAITNPGTLTGQVAIDVGGTTYYIPYYTTGS